MFPICVFFVLILIRFSEICFDDCYVQRTSLYLFPATLLFSNSLVSAFILTKSSHLLSLSLLLLF